MPTDSVFVKRFLRGIVRPKLLPAEVIHNRPAIQRLVKIRELPTRGRGSKNWIDISVPGGVPEQSDVVVSSGPRHHPPLICPRCRSAHRQSCCGGAIKIVYDY
jgi:hypothetical protein